MFFLNLFITHLFILYFEIRISKANLFVLLNKILHILLLVTMVTLVIMLFFCKNYVDRIWLQNEWLSEKESINNFFSHKIILSICFILISLYYLVKIFNVKE